MTSPDEETQRLIRFLYLCPVALAEVGNTGTVAMMNSAGARLLMPVDPTSELTNLFDALSTVAPELRQLVAQGPASEGPICEGHRIEVRRGARNSTFLAATMVRIDPQAIMAVLQDVTQTVIGERLLYADREKFRAIYEGVRGAMICTLDPNGVIDGWNSSGERLFGFASDEVQGKPLSALAHGLVGEAAVVPEPGSEIARASANGWCEIDGWQTRRDGSRFWGDGLVSALRDEGGLITGYSVVLRDMTERRLVVERLQDLATKDPLTGLANRRHFFEQAERELKLSRRHAKPLSLLMIDVDHFKRINDTHGHPVGDQVLRQLGNTLREQARVTDITARYGGEEFVVVLPSTSASGAMILAERIRVAVRECELAVGEIKVSWTVSIGAVEAHANDANIEAAIARADSALYAAKAGGRDRTVPA